MGSVTRAWNRIEGVQMKARLRGKSVMLAGILLVGCSSSPPPGGVHVQTYPVKGVVRVDGEPTSGVLVTFLPEHDSAAIKFQTFATSVDGGKFSASTYKAGDGLPAGVYKLTFRMDESEPTTVGDRTPKDRLQGAYSDPATSTYEVSVVKGGKTDFGVFDLSTKGHGT